MRIQCPACQASYEIPDHRLVQTPERVRCARCGAEWAWARALAAPAEPFELPDLFSDSPAPHAAREPVPDLSALTDPTPAREPTREPVREPIGSPLLGISPEMSLAPPQPADRMMPGEPPARPPKEPDEPVVQEAPPPPEPPPPEPPPPEPPPPELRPPRETPVEIPEVPFPKTPAAGPHRAPPPVRMDTPVEIPEVPFPREPRIVPPAGSRPTVSDLAHQRAMSREETFRRVIETTRQRSLTVPPRPSRRPQVIAILAVVLLIAIIFGVHFAMVNGFPFRPAG